MTAHRPSCYRTCRNINVCERPGRAAPAAGALPPVRTPAIRERPTVSSRASASRPCRSGQRAGARSYTRARVRSGSHGAPPARTWSAAFAAPLRSATSVRCGQVEVNRPADGALPLTLKTMRSGADDAWPRRTDRPHLRRIGPFRSARLGAPSIERRRAADQFDRVRVRCRWPQRRSRPQARSSRTARRGRRRTRGEAHPISQVGHGMPCGHRCGCRERRPGPGARSGKIYVRASRLGAMRMAILRRQGVALRTCSGFRLGPSGRIGVSLLPRSGDRAGQEAAFRQRQGRAGFIQHGIPYIGAAGLEGNFASPEDN